MADNKIKICIDKEIPMGVEFGSGEEMAIVSSKKWDTGQMLRVHFYEGNQFVKEKVRQYAREWEKYANIKFDFVDDPTAEIRVSFNLDGSSWSAVGRDALNIDWFPPNTPTMNYGWLTPDSDEDEFSRVIIHEFGHALGCIHEHSSPDANIPWDEQKVYAYYAERGWDKATVDHNVFKKYSATITQFSGFDRESIMLYPVPEELTVGNYSVGWNRQLSETDKEFIGDIYRF